MTSGGNLRGARGKTRRQPGLDGLKTQVHTSTRILHTAIIVDVFSNPQALSVTQKNLFKKGMTHGVINSSLVDAMPRNSIAAVLIDESGGIINPEPMIFYPFFSAHFAMPCKPGEKVIVIFSETTDAINLASVNTQVLGYWMTRLSVDIDVDDVNYTHADRMHPQRVNTSTADGASSRDDAEPLLTFPNGDGTQEGRTLPRAKGYDEIVNNAFANRLAPLAGSPASDAWGLAGTVGQSGAVLSYEFTGEPVPRFSKNCSDLALQGSNNTLISLGEDISNDLLGVLGASATLAPTGGRGAIDLVAGRGQGSTAPAAEKANERIYTETDKAATNQNKKEGNAASDDLSRVYISMKGTPAFFGYDGGLAVGLVPAGNTPFILAKSSAVRLVGDTAGMHAVGSGAAMQVSTGVADIQAFQTNINSSPTTMLMPITTGMGDMGGYNVCRAGPVAYFENKLMGDLSTLGMGGYIGGILKIITKFLGGSIPTGGTMVPPLPPGDPTMLLAMYGIIPLGMTMTGAAVIADITALMTSTAGGGIIAYHAFKEANFVLPVPGTNNNFGSPFFTCT